MAVSTDMGASAPARIAALLALLLQPWAAQSFDLFSDGFSSSVHRLLERADPRQRIAVAAIHDQISGDISALGDHWRDRLQRELTERGRAVVARQELGHLIDDAGSFGPGVAEAEAELWRRSSADLLVLGQYRLTPTGKGGERVDLELKLLRVADAGVLGAAEWQGSPPAGWARLAAGIRANAFQRQLEKVVAVGNAAGPALHAWLNRANPCYPVGGRATVHVETDQGAHIYLLSLAADRSAVLLYPNRRFPDKPLAVGGFSFPPTEWQNGAWALELYPLDGEQNSREAIKVIASRERLDFSFLPVPINQIHAGASGGDLKRVKAVLDRARGWTQVLLPYWVGAQCG